MPDAVIIAQAHSREGSHNLKQAGDALRERGVSVSASLLVSGHEEIRKCIRRAVKSRVPTIVLIGGDGTQTIGAAELAHSKSTLGVVPGGTGNSFAESLGIRSPDEAYDAIASGRTACVDVGVVNGKRFANFATIGLGAEISNRTPRWLKYVVGPVAYALSAIKPLMKHRPFEVRVKWKKHRLKFKTHQMLVVNGRMYGHTAVTPESTLTDGMLTFFAKAGGSPTGVIDTYLAFLTDSQTSLPQTHYFRSKKLSIKTSRKVLVSVDGSAICKTPAKFSVERNALSVFVGGGFPAP